MEKFDIFRGNFPKANPNQRFLTHPTHKKLTIPNPGQKKFIRTHHYQEDSLTASTNQAVGEQKQRTGLVYLLTKSNRNGQTGI